MSVAEIIFIVGYIIAGLIVGSLVARECYADTRDAIYAGVVGMGACFFAPAALLVLIFALLGKKLWEQT